MRTFMRFTPALGLCLLAAACAQDPVNNPGTWKVPPPGLTSNDENLKAMVVNPRDLVVGQGDSTSLAVNGASAARRELSGRRAPLPASSTAVSLSGATQQPGQQQQGAGAGAAAGHSE
jgi:hypothetical protein